MSSRSSLSVHYEAAGGVFAGLLAGAFLWFLIITLEVQIDVLICSSADLAEQFSEFLHLRDWLPSAGTSYSVTDMKLL